MKLTYKVQMVISIIVIILANIVSTILKHWIYRSIGFVVCGLLWVIHPVMMNGAKASKRNMWWVRIAGIVLILIGVFTRAYIY